MERSASCVICDDTRLEANGKLLQLGVYGTEMFVDRIPANLAKLAFIIKLRSPIGDPHRAMAVRIERPGDDDFVTPSPPFPEQAPDQNAHPDARFVETTRIVEIAPFDIKAPGRLRVWVQTEREEIYAGGVHIQTRAEGDAGIDINNILGAIVHFNANREDVKEDKEGLAASLLDFMVRRVPTELLSQAKKGKALLLPLSQNNLRVFFAAPMREQPHIALKFEPNNLRPEIILVDRFGFQVRFVPEDCPLEKFEFDISPEREAM